MRVLIIDDDEHVRQVLQEAIEERNGWTARAQGFQNLPRALVEFRPDGGSSGSRCGRCDGR